MLRQVKTSVGLGLEDSTLNERMARGTKDTADFDMNEKAYWHIEPHTVWQMEIFLTGYWFGIAAITLNAAIRLIS